MEVLKWILLNKLKNICVRFKHVKKKIQKTKTGKKTGIDKRHEDLESNRKTCGVQYTQRRNDYWYLKLGYISF